VHFLTLIRRSNADLRRMQPTRKPGSKSETTPRGGAHRQISNPIFNRKLDPPWCTCTDLRRQVVAFMAGACPPKI
jgi:hypothetical protein